MVLVVRMFLSAIVWGFLVQLMLTQRRVPCVWLGPRRQKQTVACHLDEGQQGCREPFVPFCLHFRDRTSQVKGGSLTKSLERALGSILIMPLPLWWALPQVPGIDKKTLQREEHPLLSLSLPSFPGVGSLSSQVLFAVVRVSLGQLSWNTGWLQGKTCKFPFLLQRSMSPRCHLN